MGVHAVEGYLGESSWMWKAGDKGFAWFSKYSYLILDISATEQGVKIYQYGYWLCVLARLKQG